MLNLKKCGGGLVLCCDKQRDGEEFEELPLRLTPVALGDNKTSCTIEPMSMAELRASKSAGLADRRSRENDKRALEAPRRSHLSHCR
jgi:hypothetical protein